MRIKQIYILITLILAGFAIQTVFASPALATYATSGTVTSTNLLSGNSASSITNFHYNISSLPGTSNVTIQFSTTSATWYSAAGVLNASTSLSTTGGADLSLSGLGWSGTAFYYKITLYSTSDLSGTPTIDDIRLDYAPTSGYGDLFTVNTNGNIGIGSAGAGVASSKLSVSGGATFGADYFTSTAPTNGLLVEGNVGIGSTTPTAQLSIQGLLGNTQWLFNVASSSGNSFFNILSSGDIGIGTSTPSSKLSIHDNSGLAGTNALFTIASSTAAGLSTTTLFTVLGNGNVGVGSVTPVAKFQIARATGPTTVSVANSYLHLGGSTDNSLNQLRLITFGVLPETNPEAYIGTQEMTQSGFQNEDIIFGTRSLTTDSSPLERMRITAAGLVGIGTTSPSSKLSIHDNSGLAGTNALFTIASSTAAGLSTTTLFTVLGNGNVTAAGAGTFANLTDSGLTSGRLTYASTNGLLVDSASLTFNGRGLYIASSTDIANFDPYGIQFASGADGSVSNMGSASNGFALRVFAGNSCFLAGTKVTMADDSTKNIEDIQIGDTVKSFDQANGSVADEKVVKLFHHTPSEMTDYYLIIKTDHGTEIQVTPNHRIFSPKVYEQIKTGELTIDDSMIVIDHGVQIIDLLWPQASELKVGDTLLQADDSQETIISIQKVYEKVPTYNLEVTNEHNYFAGGILVHNFGKGSTVYNGGNLYLYGGTKNGSGLDGNVILANSGYGSSIGLVGIGTSSPLARLDVYGLAGSSDIFALSSSTNARLFTVAANGNVTATGTITATGSITASSFFGDGSNLSGTEPAFNSAISTSLSVNDFSQNNATGYADIFGTLNLKDVGNMTRTTLKQDNTTLNVGGDTTQIDFGSIGLKTSNFINSATTRVTGAGTVSTSGNVVTGSGTAFLTSAHLGDTIYITDDNSARIIRAIADDTHLTVNTAPTGVSDKTYSIARPIYVGYDSTGAGMLSVTEAGAIFGGTVPAGNSNGKGNLFVGDAFFQGNMVFNNSGSGISDGAGDNEAYGGMIPYDSGGYWVGTGYAGMYFNVSGSGGWNWTHGTLRSGTVAASLDQSGNFTAAGAGSFGSVAIGSSTPYSTLSVSGSGTTNPFTVASSTGSTMLTILSSGYVGIGSNNPQTALDVLDAANPQLRLSQTNSSIYTDFKVAASTGDLTVSLMSPGNTAANITFNQPGGSTGANLWACLGDACPALTVSDGGNIVAETAYYFGNGMKIKNVDASTTAVYDTTNTIIMQFDEGTSTQ
jgi:hypothetical protein